MVFYYKIRQTMVVLSAELILKETALKKYLEYCKLLYIYAGINCSILHPTSYIQHLTDPTHSFSDTQLGMCRLFHLLCRNIPLILQTALRVLQKYCILARLASCGVIVYILLFWSPICSNNSNFKCWINQDYKKILTIV